MLPWFLACGSHHEIRATSDTGYRSWFLTTADFPPSNWSCSQLFLFLYSCPRVWLHLLHNYSTKSLSRGEVMYTFTTIVSSTFSIRRTEQSLAWNLSPKKMCINMWAFQTHVSYNETKRKKWLDPFSWLWMSCSQYQSHVPQDGSLQVPQTQNWTSCLMEVTPCPPWGANQIPAHSIRKPKACEDGLASAGQCPSLWSRPNLLAYYHSMNFENICWSRKRDGPLRSFTTASHFYFLRKHN